MWLPQTLRHWQRRLLAHTHNLVRSYVLGIAGRDRTLSLLALVDDSVRSALTRVPDALGGSAMLQTYSDWIAGIATDEPQQQLEAALPAAVAEAPMVPTQVPRSSAAVARSDNAHSLQDVCELVMYRNDGLRRLNRSLVHQISQLESDLAHTRATLVYAQRTIAQLKELNAVRAKRLVAHAGAALRQHNARTHTDVVASAAEVHQAPVCVVTGDALRLSQNDATDAIKAVDIAGRATASASSTLSHSDSDSGDAHDSGDDQPQEAQQHFTDADRDDSEPATSNYCDLLALHTPSEGEDADWHRKALRRLVQERSQRRSECASESSTPRRARFSFASSVEMDGGEAARESEDVPDDASSYRELAAMRSSDADSDIAVWQRQSLHRLSHERARRSSRASAETSVSPTHSSTSTFGASAGDKS